MPRVAFQLRIRPGKIEEYDEAHHHVWPELIRDLEQAGASEYSIFRQDTQLFLFLHVQDWDLFVAAMEASEANQRWQAMMAPLFEPGGNPMSDTGLKLMQEVFYMPGKAAV
ncbi:L-rhamnose mutarotase [Silvibacterium acidisoli]|uniref:L-rhamnose mutarotase n=1 Tax=Acidobacteriaceae bacterium ZG23-2 TaxID=2883246 RepID=UPI00406C6CC6